MNRSKLWRRIEEAATGTLGAQGRRGLFDALRDDPKARADYDLAFEALRELEHRPVAEAELDVVEAWLMDDLRAQSEAKSAWWRRPWMAAVLGLAVAAVALLVLRVPTTTLEDDGFAARGGADERRLAIDALCPQESGVPRRDGLVPAAEYGCGLTGSLSFAYRLDSVVGAGVLTLFGVDEAGDVLYYAPTPADDRGIDARPGTWTPLPMVVDLDVNHDPGAVVVYGLVSAKTPTMDQVDDMAAGLVELGPSDVSDAPWHQRLAGRDTLSTLCPTDAACESAELHFSIREVTR